MSFPKYVNNGLSRELNQLNQLSNLFEITNDEQFIIRQLGDFRHVYEDEDAILQ